jgi:hypothetical protein
MENVWRVIGGNCRHHAPVRTRVELQVAHDAVAEPVPKNRQSAVCCRRTISKNGGDFDGDHVGGDSDWKLGG